MPQGMVPPTNIFSLSGQPICVFVEASGVQSRPKLIRSLRNAGATICHTPGDAQVILVDSSTLEGVQFVREWNSDPGKVVLESTWAGKCVRAGRLLWAADNWGGCACILSGDGQTVVQNSADEEAKSHLPTPSPTPTRPDPQPSSAHPVLPPQSQPLLSSSSMHFGNGAAAFPSNRASSSTSSQGIQSSAIPLQYPQFGTPPPTSMIQSQMTQPLSAQLQLTPQMATLLPPMPQIPQHMLPELLNNFLRMAYMLPPQYQQTYQGMQPGQVPQTPYTVPEQPQSQPLVQQQPYSPTRTSAISPPPPTAPPPVVSSSTAQRARASPFSKNHPSSLKRKAPLKSPSLYSPSPSSSSRATPAGSKGKERAYSSAESDKEEDEDETPNSSQMAHTGSSPSDSAPRRTILAPREEGHIFETDAGDALLFHVQVDLKNRMQVVQAIKKNSGKVTSDIETADYIILYTRSKTFNALYDSTEANGKLPIQPSFVMDCVEEKALLDHNHYILEHPDPKRKRKKAKTAKTKSKSKRNSVTQNKIPTPKVKRKPKKIVPILDGAEHGFDCNLQSPPPPTNESRLPSGKYLFTEEEKEYAKKYIELSLMRDPTTSGTRIAQRLAAKMPAHSPVSWHTTISRMNVFTDATRKKIMAERAEAKAASEAPSAKPSPDGTDNNGSAPDGTGSDIYDQELHFLINFLMTNDLNESEAETFARLETQARCQTSSNWIQFYDEHFGDITRALGVDAASQPQPAHPTLYKIEAKDEGLN
ncbi:hypothetical protein NEOLEDRAFT_1144236 [Neolentinus lepideus HHB14362 ss-1]|uniref:BRCT domain-containing protein n=1 Tax=Neolentinus lepideus HHB14362 ss-1 TaxID=1314782 RepID=A0A165W469_9AGAM|nr:hypothetical protein NEOLEDRAFT_1144236 [Neolentinus lepideus HHB14362 ss-1]